jgi:hypothetical protein
VVFEAAFAFDISQSLFCGREGFLLRLEYVAR